MLTDPAGQRVELSTPSYQPHQTDLDHGGRRARQLLPVRLRHPATEAELDHRTRWPHGPTEPENLWPGCKADHKAKHAPGFAIEQTPEGAYTLRTPAGFRHRIEPTEHPASDTFDDVIDAGDHPVQFTATELLEAITYLREADADQRPLDLIGLWEEDCDEALADALDEIAAAA